MAISIYARPSSNLAPSATVASAEADTDYPPANLVDLNPAKPAKLNANAGSWVFTFGDPVRIDVAAVIHHNFTAGVTTVRLQANSSDSWGGTPPVDITMTIPADDYDQYPKNPWADVASLYPTPANRTYRYWRLYVVSNPAAVAVGEVLLCSERLYLERNLSYGLGDEEEQPIVEHRTDHGVSTIYHLGPKWRTWSGELNLTQSAYMTAFRELYQDARGRARGFLFVPEPGTSDAWFVRFNSTKYSAARLLTNLSRFQVGFEEVSRGLYL